MLCKQIRKYTCSSVQRDILFVPFVLVGEEMLFHTLLLKALLSLIKSFVYCIALFVLMFEAWCLVR